MRNSITLAFTKGLPGTRIISSIETGPLPSARGVPHPFRQEAWTPIADETGPAAWLMKRKRHKLLEFIPDTRTGYNF